MKSKKDTRRNNNEGSIFYREDKGLWCAIVQVGFTADNQRKRKTIYSKDKNELLEKKRQLEAELVTGTYIDSTNISTGDFLNQWLDTVCKDSLRPSTYVRYAGIVSNHLIPDFGRIPLQKLNPIHIQSLYSKRLRTGLTPSSVCYIHAVLSKALSQALKWGLVNQKVTDRVEKPKTFKKEMKVLDQDQVKIFINTAKGDNYYPLYILALTTGLRQGELVGLQWDDIDLAAGIISVKRSLKELGGKLILGEPKSRSGFRSVTIPQIAIDALNLQKSWQEVKGFTTFKYVFTDTRGNLVRVQNIVKRSFKKIIKQAGLPDIRFHDLRHTHATLLLLQGVNPKIVQERLGHSSISLTLDTYSHVLPNMQKQVTKELDNIFNSF